MPVVPNLFCLAGARQRAMEDRGGGRASAEMQRQWASPPKCRRQTKIGGTSAATPLDDAACRRHFGGCSSAGQYAGTLGCPGRRHGTHGHHVGDPWFMQKLVYSPLRGWFELVKFWLHNIAMFEPAWELVYWGWDMWVGSLLYLMSCRSSTSDRFFVC